MRESVELPAEFGRLLHAKAGIKEQDLEAACIGRKIARQHHAVSFSEDCGEGFFRGGAIPAHPAISADYNRQFTPANATFGPGRATGLARDPRIGMCGSVLL